MSISRNLLLTAFVVMLIGSAGCLVGSNSHIKREGTYISETTFRQIEPGKTTSSWVMATLGTPTEKSTVDPGHEMWKYTYKETKDSQGYVFLLFGGNDHKVTDGTVFVELKDGVVTKCWRA